MYKPNTNRATIENNNGKNYSNHKSTHSNENIILIPKTTLNIVRIVGIFNPTLKWNGGHIYFTFIVTLARSKLARMILLSVRKIGFLVFKYL